MNNEHLSTHGGNIYKAAGQLGVGPDKLLDFSANINPLGIPEVLKAAIRENIDTLVNYPDPECTDLIEAISRYVDLPKNKIIVGNGASEVIFLIFDVLRPGKVLIPAPSFSEYAQAAKRFNTEIAYFQLMENEDFILNVDKLIAEVKAQKIDAVLLCNPNNPTSKLAYKEDLYKLLDFAREQGTYVIIDEAFIELTVEGCENSMANAINSYDNLFIIRAFTKVFAIPGLRLGYGLGNEAVIKKMWDRKLPWSVNSFACYMGRILESGSEYLRQTGAWLEKELSWLYNELSKLPGIKVFEPKTNFILIKLLGENVTSGRLREKLLHKGILIRDASNFEFLNDKFIRVAVKDRSSNEALVSALTDRDAF